MIKLYTFGPAFGQPDPSPFVMKAMALLRLSGQPYTTDVFAGGPNLGPKGKLVGLYFDPTPGAFGEAQQKGIRDGAAKYPADIAGWSGLPAERFAAYTLDAVPAAEKGTFDRILVMRMMHNLLRWNIADREIKAMRELLKPDGMIGIEQHRARPDAPFSYADGSKG